MTTYRERRERRAERLRDWAESQERKSQAAFGLSADLVEQIPIGQPILVDHHSERGHRRTIDQSHRAMRRGVDSAKMAQRHLERAKNIEQAAERAIYSDDPDATEALTARITALEAQRTRMKQINAEIKKGLGWDKRLSLTEREKRDLEMTARFTPGRFGFQGYPPYAFSNLSGRLSKERKRLAIMQTEDPEP